MHKKGKVGYLRVEQETRRQLLLGERIESYWKDFFVSFEEGDRRTNCIISMVRQIETLLQKLPKLRRNRMESVYSSLCAEADTIMTGCMRI